MKQRDKEVADLGALRSRAESALQAQPRRTKVNSRVIVDTKKKLHEMQVNQIELEMQNSALMELQHAKAEIEAGLARYTDLYDLAPIGYFTLDSNGVMTEANLTAANLLGVQRSQLIGQRLASFVPARHQPDFHNFLKGVFDFKGRQSCEISLTNADGRTIFVQIEANADEFTRCCRAVMQDIGPRKRAEQALLEAKDELELRVVERTRQLESANRLLRAEIEGHKHALENLRDSKSALRQLAAHQERIKEAERRRIAREIHDELGGLLGAISTNAAVAIRNRERDGLPADHLLEDIAALSGSAFEMMRRVINDLRPGVLDQLGLWAALEWYAGKVQKRTGLKCVCDFDADVHAVEIDSDRSIAVFRMVQEALTNVERHAQASRAVVRVRIQEDSILVEVEDDGRGIEEVQVPVRERWGLIGMKERARHFGGELVAGSSSREQGIPTRPGHEKRNLDRRLQVRTGGERRCIRVGTRVTLKLPLANGGR